MKRAIEDSFPIVEINRLAAPERNAFKPIYQMHKWFARRASCVFRAILLGALKPLPFNPDGTVAKSGAQVIMDEFYKDHTSDPDTNGKVILDPFMGGGTTVVEALRLGCNVVGIDLNPVAWFIVKTETEPVDIPALEAAFDRLANRIVPWSGKPLCDTLLELYKTTCPACGGSADVIYTFWVKKAPCTSATCAAQTPLFADYIVASKTPSIFYIEDCQCPACNKTFDWEIEPAALVPRKELMVDAGKGSAGIGRGNNRWAYGHAAKSRAGIKGVVECPWCGNSGTPQKVHHKPKRKKVELTVLLCPKCEQVWQHRGPLPESVQCPTCQHEYDPACANVPDSGKFVCSCGNSARIIDAIRRMPQDKLLAMQPYALECHCPQCQMPPDSASAAPETHGDLFRADGPGQASKAHDAPTTDRLLWKANGKFFKRFDAADLALFQNACTLWEKHKTALPYPKSKIPLGEKTKSGLLSHHYYYWHQMFNPRQLLALASILDGVKAEEALEMRELLLCAFSAMLERNNMFCRFFNDRNTIQANFDRHDFAPKLTPAENSPFQSSDIRGTFRNMIDRVIAGKLYSLHPFDNDRETSAVRTRESSESVYTGNPSVNCGDSRAIVPGTIAHCDAIITDPPYAGNVNYSELSDFFYVWLRLDLCARYSQFAPDYVPKEPEIVENATRGKTNDDFRQGLYEVFVEARKKLSQDGVLVFTFHHAENEAWEKVLDAIVESGFQLTAAYPVHSDKETSLNLMDTAGISFDLVHVCKLRKDDPSTKSWAGIRKLIRERARVELQLITKGRYGQQALAPSDQTIVLIGKCLELYSAHYGKIIDHEGKPVPLHAALEAIRMMVDQLSDTELRVPHELEDIDAPSYVYLTCLCDRTEIKSDDVHKATRGICEPATLHEQQLVIKGRAKRGRSYEVKAPLDRLDLLRLRFGATARTRNTIQTELFDAELSPAIAPDALFIDHVHFLIALAQNGESVLEWLERFSGLRPQLRAAFDFLARRNRAFAEPIRKILGLLDERTLFNRKEDADA